MYWQIGLGMLVLWGIAYPILFLLLKEQIKEWMKENRFFYHKVKTSYFDWRTGNNIKGEVYKDERTLGLIIIGVVGAVLFILFYPLIMGIILGTVIYLEKVKEHPKWEKIKEILRS